MDSSEDSSDDSSSDEDSATEEDTARIEMHTTKPPGGATGSPPEGSVGWLVAGKRRVVLKDMALSHEQVQWKPMSILLESLQDSYASGETWKIPE